MFKDNVPFFAILGISSSVSTKLGVLVPNLTNLVDNSIVS
jgi:hypothetical protein